MHLQICVGEVWKYVLIFAEDPVVLMWSLSTLDEPGTCSRVRLMPWTCANTHFRISDTRVGKTFIESSECLQQLLLSVPGCCPY